MIRKSLLVLLCAIMLAPAVAWAQNAAFVGDGVTDRFCVLGEAAEHVAKLHELADAGVDQFNIYLMNGDEEAQLEAYGWEVIPAFR